MCGIAGVFGAGDGRATVGRLNDLQRHRGPDDAGIWSAPGVALGQTRLAVSDLTGGGHQPFVSADGSVAVVFNGEIYNHADLRRRHALTDAGRCDGAILPGLWQRLGTAMFAELRGMYAIAVHDVAQRALTLARDPFGIKPLHWTPTPGGLVFASELRPLLALPARPRLRRAALRRYLESGALGRDQTPFHGIEAVPAGGWSRWDAAGRRTDGVVSAGFLDPVPGTGPRELRASFLDTVAAHLRGDVPAALLLSSGLDSGALAWACAELGTSVACVTADMGAGISESAGAARLARRFGHDHEIVSAAPDAALMDRYFAAMQRPSVDGLNVFLVSRAVAGLGRRVALSGAGGDEALAGYPAFRLLRWLPLLRAGDAVGATRLLGASYRGRNAKLARLIGPDGPRDAAALGRLSRRVLTDEQLATLLPGPPPAAVATSRDVSARALALNEIAGYLGGTLLPDADAYAMAWSVELRVPFVDTVFTRAALGADPRHGVGKRGFARALGSPELDAVARGRKTSFHLPMDAWMRAGPLAGIVHAAEVPDAPVRRILAPDGVDELLRAWRAGRLTWSRAWSVVALNAWLASLGTELELAPAASGVTAAGR